MPKWVMNAGAPTSMDGAGHLTRTSGNTFEWLIWVSRGAANWAIEEEAACIEGSAFR